jgi:hypothetical protein
VTFLWFKKGKKMNKKLILSVATAALLSPSLSAEATMFERFQAMELEMNKLKSEIATLKEAKASDVDDAEDNTEEQEEKASQGEDEEDEEEEFDVVEEIKYLQESVTEINKNTSGSHLKFGVDYRFTLDNLDYTMADGSEAKNDALMSNRLWINMDWMANENLSFTGQLAYNKTFGARSGANDMNDPYEKFDWIANENAYNDSVRVRSAYFLYRNDTFIGADMPWTFSVGRRPSTNGHLVNLRDDDKAASPMGHSINVEFDGLSSKFSFENLTGINGMYVKLCAGRGMSNATARFNASPYSEDENANPDIDLAGLIFVPYDDGQYSLNTQYYYANNLIDADLVNGGFDTVGAMHSATANIKIHGIGNYINDFLDDTIFFVSGAMSKTAPKENHKMLDPMSQDGESKTGYSVWVGTQFPSLISYDGRWGLEYNKGTKYWRSITYGEDTNIGSKIAARGDAYEAYFTEYLVEDILSMQIRYTYIDYKYSGSNGFFGATTGASMEIANSMMTPNGDIAGSVVDKAQDIRFYLRYKY